MLREGLVRFNFRNIYFRAEVTKGDDGPRCGIILFERTSNVDSIEREHIQDEIKKSIEKPEQCTMSVYWKAQKGTSTI